MIRKELGKIFHAGIQTAAFFTAVSMLCGVFRVKISRILSIRIAASVRFTPGFFGGPTKKMVEEAAFCVKTRHIKRVGQQRGGL